MPNVPASTFKKLPILTEEDILAQVRAILQYGYGQVEIDIFDGYIRTIKPSPTILGRRP